MRERLELATPPELPAKFRRPGNRHTIQVRELRREAAQNGIQTVKEFVELTEFESGCRLALTLATKERGGRAGEHDSLVLADAVTAAGQCGHRDARV
jgi:hypothetical protein